MNIFTTVLSGDIDQISDITLSHQDILLATDPNVRGLPQVEQLIARLRESCDHLTVIDDLPAEPREEDVLRLIQQLPATINFVIGVGGGSVLDVSKLIAVFGKAEHSARVERFKQLLTGEKPTERAELLLIPTTAGTGAEATPNAIVAIPERATKVGIISPVLLPDYVLLAPELTTSMPAHITASTSVDALCHLIECFTASVSNPIGDNYALIGMQKFFANIEKVITSPDNLLVRLNLLWASYFGGASISHSGTHLVHALSYPLGGKFRIPHGLANSLLLVPCMKFICKPCQEKMAQVYDLLPDADPSLAEEKKAQAVIDYLESLVAQLGLPTRLNDIGIEASQLPELARSAMEVKRLIANSPVPVTEQEVLSIYNSICE
ncbi:iron-containing alcohol dehydrogenase [Vibrio mangrovi]|uniref:Alcohol dehydrogenase n=1 Tax=Vibrio mangrovi TaxID=474394 RepID=A0A1Y6IYC6_9VIBR|nr:iron-containing alcohol dehydrogenase [Vibrio mangrovi]MDW6004762.1 iron-containing alcohol dehydrogenase [Vibrio mangrovi]SMS01053.1 Alcohol dehydrogenase [Vibrio mangrovi]